MKSSVVWLSLVTSILLPRSSHAALLWWGDPSKGTMVFKNFLGDGNCGTGSITTVTDPIHGLIFRYEKPAASNRCENHGIRVDGLEYAFQNNASYYLAWWSKLSSTANNNANFQWKSYENHIQNFPIVLKMLGGQMSLMYTPPGGGSSIIWRRALQADTWHHYVLGIKTSNAIRGGAIEFWFDGMKQMLGASDQYAARTWDSGDHNCPKWGVYGGRGTTMTNHVADLRIATTYEEVAMGSPRPMPGPGGTPADAGAQLGDAGTSDTAGAPPVDAAGTGGVGGGGGPAGGSGGNPGRKDSGTPPAVEEESPDAAEITTSSSRSAGGCQLSARRALLDGWWPLGLLLLALRARRRSRATEPPC